MADPAASDDRDAGNPTDEEERPDLAAVEVMLAAITGTEWRADPAEGVVTSSAGLEVFWAAPDMEGHADRIANLVLAAAAPTLLRRFVDEVRRLRSLAGIVE